MDIVDVKIVKCRDKGLCTRRGAGLMPVLKTMPYTRKYIFKLDSIKL